MRGLVFAAVSLLAARSAAADCPMDAGDSPARGFLAAATTEILPEAKVVEPSWLLAGSAAAEARAGDSDEPLAASLSGEAQAGTGGVRGCAAATLSLDSENSSTASVGALVPFFFTGIGAGVTVTHQRELALDARPSWLGRRISEVRGHVSLAFIDLPLADAGSRARLQVVPFRVETARDAGATGVVETEIATAMFRFAVDAPAESGEVEIFAVSATTIDSDTGPASGFARFSLLDVVGERGPWRYAFDVPALTLGGEGACDRCTRIAYLAKLGWSARGLELGGHAARTGFALYDGTLGYEDRVSATAGLHRPRMWLRGRAFAAAARRWEGEPLGVAAGASAAVGVPLGRGFAAVLRGELARSFYAPGAEGEAPTIRPAARLLAALSWRGQLDAAPDTQVRAASQAAMRSATAARAPAGRTR